MGEAYTSLNIFCNLSTSDWVNIFGFAVNAGLAIWIIKTIQYNQNNRRVLKDHFINEMKDIRTEYKNCLNNLYSNNTHPQRIIPWLK